MKIFGYQKNGQELLELREATIACRGLDELDKIIDFLIEVRKEHASVSGITPMCHSHFRDWDSTWKKGDPDFIISNQFKDLE